MNIGQTDEFMFDQCRGLCHCGHYLKFGPRISIPYKKCQFSDASKILDVPTCISQNKISRREKEQNIMAYTRADLQLGVHHKT